MNLLMNKLYLSFIYNSFSLLNLYFEKQDNYNFYLHEILLFIYKAFIIFLVFLILQKTMIHIYSRY